MEILTLSIFRKKLKSFAKKNPNMKKDYKYLLDTLEKNPKNGIHICENVYKIRLKNSSNNKGKSSGYRVYYLYKDSNNLIILLYIYTKNEFPNLPNDLLDKLLLECKSLK